MERELPERTADCLAIEAQLAAGPEQTLSTEEEMRIQAHLAACPRCRQIGREHRRAWDLLEHASLPPPLTSDAEFIETVRSRARRTTALRSILWLTAAAAALIAAGVLWLAPPPVDPAVIENVAVLQDLQEIPALQDSDLSEGAPEVSEVGQTLLAILEDEPASLDDLNDVIDLLPDDLPRSEAKRG